MIMMILMMRRGEGGGGCGYSFGDISLDSDTWWGGEVCSVCAVSQSMGKVHCLIKKEEESTEHVLLLFKYLYADCSDADTFFARCRKQTLISQHHNDLYYTMDQESFSFIFCLYFLYA